MTGINRRRMLQAIGAATAGAAATTLGTTSVFASFSAPARGLRYRKYAGTDFHPRNTVQKDGSRSERTYFDNGAIYSSGGANDVFVAPLQLPDGARIREIQFSYSLTDDVPILVQFFGFDLENHFTGFSETVPPPIPSDPDPLHIRTYTMTGTPVRVDNTTWSYVLRYGPQVPGPSHILWGARVGYQSHEGAG
jgi:hypothetical protein